jgi:hypothetical protein
VVCLASKHGQHLQPEGRRLRLTSPSQPVAARAGRPSPGGGRRALPPDSGRPGVDLSAPTPKHVDEPKGHAQPNELQPLSQAPSPPTRTEMRVPVHGCQTGAECPVLAANRTSCVPIGFSDDDPINGYRIGTQCPILHANRTSCVPVSLSETCTCVMGVPMAVRDASGTCHALMDLAMPSSVKNSTASWSLTCTTSSIVSSFFSVAPALPGAGTKSTARIGTKHPVPDAKTRQNASQCLAASQCMATGEPCSPM